MLMLLFCICSVLVYLPILINTASVTLESLENCPDVRNDLGDYRLYFLYSTYNETHRAITGNVSLQEDFGSQYSALVEVAKWMNDKWREKMFVLREKSACGALLKYFKSAIVGVSAAAGVPNPDKCPYRKGNYAVSDFAFSLNGLNVPLLPGKYRITLKALKKQIPHACLNGVLVFQ